MLGLKKENNHIGVFSCPATQNLATVCWKWFRYATSSLL